MALSTKAKQDDLDLKANIGDITLSYLELRLDTSVSGTALPSGATRVTWNSITNNVGSLFSVSTDMRTITALRDCYVNINFIFGLTCSLETHVRIEVRINTSSLNNGMRYYLYKTNEYDYRDITIPNIKLNENDEVDLIVYAGTDSVSWNNYPTNFPASLVLTEVKLKGN